MELELLYIFGRKRYRLLAHSVLHCENGVLKTNSVTLSVGLLGR